MEPYQGGPTTMEEAKYFGKESTSKKNILFTSSNETIRAINF
jgi:hypothetical protein